VTAAPQLTYGAMRLRWCRLALLAFVQRWAVYIVVAVAVLGAGATGFVTIIMGAAAWLVLPLFYAAGQGFWLLPAVLLQTLVGAAAVWGMRHLLWPLPWAQAERALPIADAERMRSDLLVVLIALLPLLLLYGAGAASLWGQNPEWLRPFRLRAVGALLVAAAASLLLGVGLLQRMRRPAFASARRVRAPVVLSLTASLTASLAASTHGVHWSVALLLWPLWRGPARRTGQALWWGSGLLLVPAVAMALSHVGTAWWLAALALCTLLVATRINHLAREELGPLLQAGTMLPLRLDVAERLRASLGVWPVLLALGLTTLVLTFEESWRPVVWAAFVIALLLSVVVEVLSPPGTPEAKAARWLFSLVLCVCLATEVMV
jgi:hypothetical protein